MRSKLFICFIILINLFNVFCSSEIKYNLYRSETEVISTVQDLIDDSEYWENFSTNLPKEEIVISCANLLDKDTFSIAPLTEINTEILDRIKEFVPEFEYSRNIWVVTVKNNPPYAAFSTVWYVIDESLESIPTKFSAEQNSRRC